MSQSILNLHFKWTVSRGQNTYGYNVCTLLVNGQKVGRCNGGGYDMKGTSFGQWLQSQYQQQLQSHFAKEIAAVSEKDYKGDSGYCYKSIDGFYGATIDGAKGQPLTISLDGGCGFENMKRIAEVIGIKLQWNPESNRYKNHDFYTALIAA